MIPRISLSYMAQEYKNNVEYLIRALGKIVSIQTEKKIKYSTNENGLLSGIMGNLVFLGQYLKAYLDSNVYKTFEYLIDKFCSVITTHAIPLNYCDGIAGIIKGFDILNELNIVSVDTNSLIDLSKIHAMNYLHSGIKRNNIDFLYGSIGIAYGFWQDEEIPQLTISLIKKNLNLNCVFERNYKFGCPYGSAHGVASVLSLLLNAVNCFDNKKVALQLLEEIAYKTIEQVVDVNIYNSYFPTTIEDIKSKSDLGWCKGDLSLSVVLLRTSLILELYDIKKLSIDILHHCAKRVLSNNEGLDNLSLCHGAAGIGLLFNRAFELTENELFKHAENKCLNKCLDMLNTSLPQVLNGSSIINLDLLEGLSGIGLYLLHHLNKNDLHNILLI